MSSETLHALSTIALFVGLLLTALGGFGTLRLGRSPRPHAASSSPENIQTLAEEARLLKERLEIFESAARPLPKETPDALRDVLQRIEQRLAALETRTAADPATPSAKAAAPKRHARSRATAAKKPVKKTKEPVSFAADADGLPPVPEPIGEQPEEAQILTDRQRRVIKRSLAGTKAPSPIDVEIDGDDPAAGQLARNLRDILQQANWRVRQVKKVSNSPPQRGLTISSGTYPTPESAAALFVALTQAGFQISSKLDPGRDEECPALIVGPGATQ